MKKLPRFIYIENNKKLLKQLPKIKDVLSTKICTNTAVIIEEVVMPYVEPNGVLHISYNVFINDLWPILIDWLTKIKKGDINGAIRDIDRMEKFK